MHFLGWWPEVARQFILEHWEPLMALDEEPPVDSKTALRNGRNADNMRFLSITARKGLHTLQNF